ncbi:hypothetical protein BC829DRAFT_415462 [Chytridium lagenaria]|nr:hypothetical protein BC829DRAFT_415462 [Chytridium lagenaria]
MHLSSLPQGLLSGSLLPFLDAKDLLKIAGVSKQLRLAFLPYAYSTIHSHTTRYVSFRNKPPPTEEISRAIQAFKNSPDVIFYVKEVSLTFQTSCTVIKAHELLSLIGSRLEGLFCMKSRTAGMMTGVLDIVIEETSEQWWRSGGKEELISAIGGLTKLVSLSASCGYDDWDSRRDSPEGNNGLDFTLMMLETLAPNLLTEKLTVKSQSEKIERVVLQAAKQKAIKNLELLLYYPPKDEDLAKARTLRCFSDFDRLENLNVTLMGFTYIYPAFPHLRSLRHLVIGSMECYDVNIWTNLREFLYLGL